MKTRACDYNYFVDARDRIVRQRSEQTPRVTRSTTARQRGRPKLKTASEVYGVNKKKSQKKMDAIAETNKPARKGAGPMVLGRTEYDQRVALWQKHGQLLIIHGMGARNEPAEFKKDCRARLSFPDSAQIFWKAATGVRKHHWWAAAGFETGVQRAIAESDLNRWKWREHPIHTEVKMR
ncbi:hypothetical protein NLG97_g5558 [Lecanicillium saksenae]|uniref:Uncharacterized protein n=1 Tax=Lecanicillium saksenae TaxID=468837 RepID=A0ACC1QS50_9HYPO|nr:hypothetical protein NLG97_g5558 [Lecanicillium saksenae]